MRSTARSNFATVRNPHPDAVLDTLGIQLSNAAAPCGPNPRGLDNLVVE